MSNCVISSAANKLLRSKADGVSSEPRTKPLTRDHDDVGVRDRIAGAHRRPRGLRQPLQLLVADSLERDITEERLHLGDTVWADRIHFVRDQYAIERPLGAHGRQHVEYSGD